MLIEMRLAIHRQRAAIITTMETMVCNHPEIQVLGSGNIRIRSRSTRISHPTNQLFDTRLNDSLQYCSVVTNTIIAHKMNTYSSCVSQHTPTLIRSSSRKS